MRRALNALYRKWEWQPHLEKVMNPNVSYGGSEKALRRTIHAG
jgi:hypothetical protein